MKRTRRWTMADVARLLCDSGIDFEAVEAKRIKRRAGRGEIDDNIAHAAPYVERDPSHGPKTAAKGKEVSPRFCVRVHSVRRRLIDPDGLYFKAALDGIAAGGILADDSSRVVKEISYEQSLAEKGEGEETIIVIEEVPEVI